jgi:hypothetical protein
MIQRVFLLGFCLFFTISCKETSASKVKVKNIELAKKRDLILADFPIASFDKVTYDFGSIRYDELVETTFVVTNTGKADLIISNAKASCGCTVPKWPKEPIKVGDSAKIEVKFNPKGKKNKQSKSITLTTNTANGEEVLRIKGFINPKPEY